MCYRMCMLERRVQILLDDDRYRKVAQEAKRRQVSLAAVIREAIDRLPMEADRRRAAIDAVLSAEPMPVPADPSDVRRELDSGHLRAFG